MRRSRKELLYSADVRDLFGGMKESSDTGDPDQPHLPPDPPMGGINEPLSWSSRNPRR
jgi:hypothetical protein